MTRAGASTDISIQPPGYSEDVGLPLLVDESGVVAFKKTTRSILPTAAPPAAPNSESFDPQVRVEFAMRSAHAGVGFDRFIEGGDRAGLVKNVNTLFEDQFFSGPKIRYINDINYLDNGTMEAFTAGVPDSWTKVSGPTTAEENTIVDEGTSSVKITSVGAGDLLRYTLAHGEFLQCVLRLTGKVYVTTGEGAAIARIANSIGDVDYTSTTNDAWESISVDLTVATTALSSLSVDLIPATNDFAYFDDMKLEILYLTGPPGPFVELEISGTDTLFHFSGRTTWKQDTADLDPNGLPRWIATELASHNITDCVTMNDRMWRAEGPSGLWTHSTDGVTWTDNTLSGADRFADQLAVTQTIFGFDALWKTTKPDQLIVSTTPSTGGWSTYTIGSSDTDILDLVVEHNVLYIIKEDGVFMIGRNGLPLNITSSWSHMRQTARSKGGHGWLGDAYIPAGSHGLWRINPRTRRPAHPGSATPAYDEYNGPVTQAIGDDSWLYAFVQKRTSATPTLTNIMAGRPIDDTKWRWGQVAEIDAGMVRHGWITGTQRAGTQMYWSSQETEGSTSSVSDESSSTAQANTDNSSGREWSNPSNAGASDDAYATWPDETALSQTKSSGTEAVTDYTPGETWDNPGNAAASDDSRATSDLDEVTGSLTDPTVHNTPTGWSNHNNILTSDDADAKSDSVAAKEYTNHFEATTFGLAVPATALVTNITVTVEGTRDGGGADVYGGIIVGGARKTEQLIANNLNAEPSADSTGSKKDTPTNWGSAGLTGANVNAANFGIFFRIYNDGAGATAYNIDNVQVKVDYTLAETDGLRVTNFSFGGVLPADAEIKGIEVAVERMADTGTALVDKLVQLVVGGALVGDSKADAVTSWPTTEASVTYGSSTELWGLTPTRTQVVAADFGVEVRATKGASLTDIQARVDHITITIHYDSNETSDYLDLQDWDFDIPTGATIDGIIVSVERKSSTGTVKDASLQLLNASGTPAGDDKAAVLDAWPTTDAIKSYGGTSDTWNITPTVTMVNDADFGVRISVSGDVKDDVASIDHVSMKVYYTPASGSELNNRMGWISVPDTENPRYDPNYEYEGDGTMRTGRITRFPGWKTAWQEVTVKTSPNAGEKLGSNGRQIAVKYNTFDGTGFNELGGSGNGDFATSPAQTKYFKTGSVASVVSEDIELEVTLEHTETDETPVVTEVSVAGTVRPRIVDVFEYTVLIGDDVGGETSRGAAKLAALRAMLDPDQWSSILNDREGTAHNVIPFVNGYEEIDVLHYPDATTGEGIIVRAVNMQVFKIPNSDSWSS